MPGGDAEPALSFVIPVRNGGPALARCLASIHDAANGVPHEVVVADNGSTDDSGRVAADAGARVLALPDRSVSAVRNVAAAATRAPLLAFVDADHELVGGWADAALDLMRDPALSAAGNQYAAPDPGTWVQQMCDRLRRHRPDDRHVDWLPSGNLVVRRDAFDRVGGFDESLTTCEDVDLCRRLIEAGGSILASERLRSVHHGDPRTLGALFRGELWRGRDNLKVTLRGPISLKAVPGLVLPVMTLASYAGIVTGLLTWPAWGGRLAAASALVLAALIAVRTASLLTSGPRVSPAGLGRMAAFAAVFDAARGLSLILPGGHGLRRGRAAAAA